MTSTHVVYFSSYANDIMSYYRTLFFLLTPYHWFFLWFKMHQIYLNSLFTLNGTFQIFTIDPDLSHTVRIARGRSCTEQNRSMKFPPACCQHILFDCNRLKHVGFAPTQRVEMLMFACPVYELSTAWAILSISWCQVITSVRSNER